MIFTQTPGDKEIRTERNVRLRYFEFLDSGIQLFRSGRNIIFHTVEYGPLLHYQITKIPKQVGKLGYR
jgi:hypothetical protein